MSKSRTPFASASDTPDTAVKPSHHHPVGLLYTLLRHGRGLTHEEARRRSTESIGGPPVNGPSVNNTHVKSTAVNSTSVNSPSSNSSHADGPPKAA